MQSQQVDNLLICVSAKSMVYPMFIGFEWGPGRAFPLICKIVWIRPLSPVPCEHALGVAAGQSINCNAE